MINFNKTYKRVYVPYLLHWEEGVKISKIKQDIEELEKLGATHIEFLIIGDDIEINPSIIRFETDEEFNERIEIERKREEEREKLLSTFDPKQLQFLRTQFKDRATILSLLQISAVNPEKTIFTYRPINNEESK